VFKYRAASCGGSECKECEGSQICQHGRRRTECKECGGGSICQHNRQRSKCKDCRGSSSRAGKKRKATEELPEDLSRYVGTSPRAGALHSPSFDFFPGLSQHRLRQLLRLFEILPK